MARLTMAGVGAFLGAMFVGLAVIVSGGAGTQREAPLISLLYGAVPWAVAGAITAKRLRVIRTALAVAAAGLVLAWTIAASQRASESFLVAMVFGAGPGLILGALAGAVWNRKRGSVASPVES
jgi:hypothetical protein